MNGYRQEGLGPMDMTVHKDRRWSTTMAHLLPAMKRPNLSVRTRALVAREAFEPDSSPPRDIGVEVVNDHRTELVRDRGEVILCSGVINSPQLLQRSGVGSPDDLRNLDIPVIASLRGEVGLKHRDLQYHFLPMSIQYDGSAPATFHGFQAHVGPMCLTSWGAVTMKSANPQEAPRILFKYLATEQDRKKIFAGIRLTREIFEQKVSDRFRGKAVWPKDPVQTDAEIGTHIREHGESALHPSCTCRMGTDEISMTDGNGRVHSVADLRVVDASLMPDVVSGNLNAPTIMLAKKLADTIRGKTPLPRSDASFFVHPHHQSA